jgi:hypothetical protein
VLLAVVPVKLNRTSDATTNLHFTVQAAFGLGILESDPISEAIRSAAEVNPTCQSDLPCHQAETFSRQFHNYLAVPIKEAIDKKWVVHSIQSNRNEVLFLITDIVKPERLLLSTSQQLTKKSR